MFLADSRGCLSNKNNSQLRQKMQTGLNKKGNTFAEFVGNWILDFEASNLSTKSGLLNKVFSAKLWPDLDFPGEIWNGFLISSGNSLFFRSTPSHPNIIGSAVPSSPGGFEEGEDGKHLFDGLLIGDYLANNQIFTQKAMVSHKSSDFNLIFVDQCVLKFVWISVDFDC